jgi:hypothetical protein
LVGLFFATEEGHQNDEEDGALWCLWPKDLNQRANIEMELVGDLPFFEVDDHLDSYLPSTIAARTMVDLEPMAAGAQRRFPRLHAQLGVFTITHKSKQEILEGPYLAKITIPHAYKKSIRTQLALLGITRLTIFPELESVGMLTREVKL